ncbi:HAMP domain-containing histidine kinase [Trinickia violacea]|uniref:histidine kinase n=1 Tax=Trinickia violacea TaxID=2571746 RepID=A0A4P8IUP0_9BURK|nr:HAMP domain-containing sensor histidine kinase [Trinickia violacea]QCP52988.1 HAMP domain-containing histidine kinase [Trinickia violacea]
MFKHWIRSLSARLWLTSVAALALGLALLATSVIYVLERYPDPLLGRREQLEFVAAVARGLNFDSAGHPVSVQLPEPISWLFNVTPTEVQYRVLDENGRLLMASANARSGDPWLAERLSDVSGTIAHATINGRPYGVATERIVKGQTVSYVQCATSAHFIKELVKLKVKPIPEIVSILLLIATVTFGLTLPLTIHRVLKPLREASRAAEQITPRNLTTRLSTTGVPSEIKPLIDAFNEALGRLENGFTVQQQFLAAAAHELQTPLTLVRGQIELQPEIKDKELLLREIDLMARQVRQLLHLAEVSESQNFTFGQVIIADVAQDVVAYLARKADAKEVKLEIEPHPTLPAIWADRSALFIMLKNIVENAINVSPPKSVVSLAIDEASIQIRDEGPGIRQEHLPFLFKRFWRAPDAKHDGAGLGLAICKEIAIAHEWRLTVSRLAAGTCFTVWL